MSKDQDSVQSNVPFLKTTQDTLQAPEDDYSVPYELKISAGGMFDVFLH